MHTIHLKQVMLLILAAVLIFDCGPSSQRQSSPSPTTASAQEVQDTTTPSTATAAKASGHRAKFPPPPGAMQLSKVSCQVVGAEHVYNPGRLWLLDAVTHPCVQMTLDGVIESAKAEPDGDFHIRFRIDPLGHRHSCFDQPCINAENNTQQHGDLVLEPVCENTVTQTDAMSACRGYQNKLVAPRPGTHVTATGYWVFDEEHGWNELHPLLSLV